MKKKSSYGGRRPGAGRKPLGEDKMVRVNVMLETKHIEQAARIGDGNVSRGIRLLIDAEIKKVETSPAIRPAPMRKTSRDPSW